MSNACAAESLATVPGISVATRADQLRITADKPVDSSASAVAILVGALDSHGHLDDDAAGTQLLAYPFVKAVM